MLHHEESPKNPQYNMATPPFLDNHPHFALTPTPFLSILKKSNPPHLYEGGFKLCNHKVKVSVKATCYDIKSWHILKGAFGTMQQKP